MREALSGGDLDQAVTAPARDDEGYLVNLADWSPRVAEQIAKEAQLELLADHWELIELVRDFHERTDVVPAMRPLVKLVRDNLGAAKGNSLHLNLLFPDGAAKLLAKVAGLPKPTNCL